MPVIISSSIYSVELERKASVSTDCYFLLFPPGGDPAGRGDPVRSAAAGVPRGPPPPQEAQAGAHPVHDGVVHVRLLSDSALGLSAARLGHVPL